MTRPLDETRALLVGQLAHAGLDVRVTGQGHLVVRTACRLSTLRRVLYPHADAVYITRPARGYYVLQFRPAPETTP